MYTRTNGTMELWGIPKTRGNYTPKTRRNYIDQRELCTQDQSKYWRLAHPGSQRITVCTQGKRDFCDRETELMILHRCKVKSGAGTPPKIQVNVYDWERFVKYILLTLSGDPDNSSRWRTKGHLGIAVIHVKNKHISAHFPTHLYTH